MVDKMENSTVKTPTTKAPRAVNIRRHRSLPGPLHSIRPQVGRNRSNSSSTLRHNKLNPYVGWFRHAPPASSKRLASAAVVMSKGQKYYYDDSFFRRYYCNNTKKSLNWIELQDKLYYAKTEKNSNCFLLKRRGHLRGGCPEDDEEEQQFEVYLQGGVRESESVTVKLLSRIACWLLDVPLVETPPFPTDSNNKRKPIVDVAENASLVSDNEDDDDISEYDNYDTVVGSGTRTTVIHGINNEEDSSSMNRISSTNSFTMSSSAYLSSQGEAYHALNTVHSQILESSSQNSDTRYYRSRSQSLGGNSTNSNTNDETSTSRLDYDITQMDIVRMNRVASRHLDVQSIVKLPIITYYEEQDDNSQEKITARRKNDKLIEIPEETTSRTKNQDVADNKKHTTTDHHQDNDNGFSWMLVTEPVEPCHNNANINSNDSSIHNDNNQDQQQQQKEEEDLQQERDVCVICLEHFIPGDRLRVLPCNHSFHVGCIDKWLSGSHSFDDCYTTGCPTCKKRPDHHDPDHNHNNNSTTTKDGHVPSWAFARIGDALARESFTFTSSSSGRV